MLVAEDSGFRYHHRQVYRIKDKKQQSNIVFDHVQNTMLLNYPSAHSFSYTPFIDYDFLRMLHIVFVLLLLIHGSHHILAQILHQSYYYNFLFHFAPVIFRLVDLRLFTNLFFQKLLKLVFLLESFAPV